MRRVAVFGNAGGGKSTLSKRLAEITDLPLIFLDLMWSHVPGNRFEHRFVVEAHIEEKLLGIRLLRLRKYFLEDWEEKKKERGGERGTGQYLPVKLGPAASQR